MNEPIYSVEQLNQFVKAVFDAEELLHRICIRGEVSSFGISGKNAYFTLKDSSAQIPCTFFGYNEAPLHDGEKVRLIGSPNYYVRGGKLSFNVESIEKAGEGDLYRCFLELKAKLEDEGLFTQKIEIPSKIRRIGVVTSASGAVIHDIVSVATRRDPSIDIVLYPVKVQGIGAEEEISTAISRLDIYKKVDVIVVARGGGSMEDLAAYNTELVARTVAKCNKYIVSAVGHDTDFTLCDFCADLRAPTASAAAELLTTDIRQRYLVVARNINNNFNALTDKYDGKQNKLKDLVVSLSACSSDNMNLATSRLTDRLYHMDEVTSRKWIRMREQTRNALQRLELINPTTILKSGYAALLNMNNERLQSIHDVKRGDSIQIRMQDGMLNATVDATITK